MSYSLDSRSFGNKRRAKTCLCCCLAGGLMELFPFRFSKSNENVCARNRKKVARVANEGFIPCTFMSWNFCKFDISQHADLDFGPNPSVKYQYRDQYPVSMVISGRSAQFVIMHQKSGKTHVLDRGWFFILHTLENSWKTGRVKSDEHLVVLILSICRSRQVLKE